MEGKSIALALLVFLPLALAEPLNYFGDADGNGLVDMPDYIALKVEENITPVTEEKPAEEHEELICKEGECVPAEKEEEECKTCEYLREHGKIRGEYILIGIGVLLIVYGTYRIIKERKRKKKKDIEENGGDKNKS